MPNQKKELGVERFSVGLGDIDLDKILRIGNKVNDILDKKIRNPVERYLVLKMLLISFEETAQFTLSPQDEEMLRAYCHDESLDEK